MNYRPRFFWQRRPSAPAALFLGALVILTTLAAPAADASPTTPAAFARPSPQQSVQDKIAQARREGRISTATSLLYRAYALQADPRLPAEYHSTTNTDDTFRLMADAAQESDTLPPDIATQLRPYLVRPADPASIFNTTGYQPRARKSTVCQKDAWCGLASHRYHVKLWIKGTGAAAQDIAVLHQGLSLIEALWQPMTHVMGQPLPDTPRKAKTPTQSDDGNDDSRIDVYLVPSGQTVQRNGTHDSFGTALAAAVATPARGHRPPQGKSAFMLMNVDRLADPEFKTFLAHEFFHVLQFAHVAGVAPTQCANGQFWFDEASAVWAESYFVPETAQTEVYPRFAEFQAELNGLQNTSEPSDPFAGFIWPYFMQQQAGPKSIAAAYRAMEKATTCADLTNAVDAHLSFAANFHTFALRNLNTPLFGDSLRPINPRYNTLHADFPDGQMPPLTDAQVILAGSDVQLKQFTPAPLQAWYYHLLIDPDVDTLTLDFTLPDAYDVDGVVSSSGQWTVRNLAGETVYDRSTDPVDELYVVISCHAKLAADCATGSASAGTPDLRVQAIPPQHRIAQPPARR